MARISGGLWSPRAGPGPGFWRRLRCQHGRRNTRTAAHSRFLSYPEQAGQVQLHRHQHRPLEGLGRVAASSHHTGSRLVHSQDALRLLVGVASWRRRHSPLILFRCAGRTCTTTSYKEHSGKRILRRRWTNLWRSRWFFLQTSQGSCKNTKGKKSQKFLINKINLYFPPFEKWKRLIGLTLKRQLKEVTMSYY